MPIRNPFRKAGVVSGLDPVNDENSRPGSKQGQPDRGFERIPLPSSKSSTSILSIKSKREEPNEYKLSGMMPSHAHAIKRRTVLAYPQTAKYTDNGRLQWSMTAACIFQYEHISGWLSIVHMKYAD